MMSSMKMTSELKVKGSLFVGKGGKWEAEWPSRHGGMVVPRTAVRRRRPGSSLQERSPPGQPQQAKHHGAGEQGEVSSR